MKYALDTNFLITLAVGHSEKQKARLLAHEEAAFGVSSIVAHELYFGAFKGRDVERNLEFNKHLLCQFQVIEFSSEDARASGEIRASLAKVGQTIGPYDVLIAGQAMARGLTLLTSNIREFARVKGLAVEDWTG